MGDAQGRLIKDDCSSGGVAGGDVEEVDRLIVLQEESALRLTESSKSSGTESVGFKDCIMGETSLWLH